MCIPFILNSMYWQQAWLAALAGTGWPSFYAPIDPEHVIEVKDNSIPFMPRVEVLDARRQVLLPAAAVAAGIGSVIGTHVLLLPAVLPDPGELPLGSSCACSADNVGYGWLCGRCKACLAGRSWVLFLTMLCTAWLQRCASRTRFQ